MDSIGINMSRSLASDDIYKGRCVGSVARRGDRDGSQEVVRRVNGIPRVRKERRFWSDVGIAQDVSGPAVGGGRRSGLQEAEQVGLSRRQVVGEAQATLPQEKPEEEAGADAEDGHGEAQPSHRSGSVGRAKVPVGPRTTVGGRVAGLGGHLQRVGPNVGQLKFIRNPDGHLLFPCWTQRRRPPHHFPVLGHLKLQGHVRLRRDAGEVAVSLLRARLLLPQARRPVGQRGAARPEPEGIRRNQYIFPDKRLT